MPVKITDGDTVYMLVIPKRLHYRLKMVSVGERTSMKQLILKSIEKFIKAKI